MRGWRLKLLCFVFLLILFPPLLLLLPFPAVWDCLPAPGVCQLYPTHSQVLQPEHYVLHQRQKQVNAGAVPGSDSWCDEGVDAANILLIVIMDWFLAVYVCWIFLTVWSTRCPSSRQRASWVKTDRSPLDLLDCAGVILTLLCLFRKQETTTSSAGGTSSLALTCCGSWTSWRSGSTPGRWWDRLARC